MGMGMSCLAVKRRVPSLPQDFIVAEILTRLPVKSVYRCKSVCKSWNSLVTANSSFVKSHLAQIFINPAYDSQIIWGYYPWRIWIVGSVNGLVCHYKPNYVTPVPYTIQNITIWNPATKQVKEIPLPEKKLTLYSSCLGFGFDSDSDDYKILCISSLQKQPLHGEIYSCNTGCWKNIVPFDFIDQGLLCGPVIATARLYWHYIKYSCRTVICGVISFDFRSEVFRLLPELELPHNKARKLMNFRDSLAVATFENLNITMMDVYTLDECCGVWSKTYMIEMASKITDVLHCFRNGDILFVDHERKLFSIDPETRRMKRFHKEWRMIYYYSFGYTQSLVSIKGMKQLQEKDTENYQNFFYLNKSDPGLGKYSIYKQKKRLLAKVL